MSRHGKAHPPGDSSLFGVLQRPLRRCVKIDAPIYRPSLQARTKCAPTMKAAAATYFCRDRFLLFQKVCAILARLFDKREVDDAGADPSNRASASGRPLQPIENTQNQRENLWGNLEKFANSLQLSSLGFNKIKGLTRSKPRLRFDSELFFGPFWRCQRPAQRAGCGLSGGIRLQRWIASPLGVAMAVVDGFR